MAGARDGGGGAGGGRHWRGMRRAEPGSRWWRRMAGARDDGADQPRARQKLLEEAKQQQWSGRAA